MEILNTHFIKMHLAPDDFIRSNCLRTLLFFEIKREMLKRCNRKMEGANHGDEEMLDVATMLSLN